MLLLAVARVMLSLFLNTTLHSVHDVLRSIISGTNFGWVGVG